MKIKTSHRGKKHKRESKRCGIKKEEEEEGNKEENSGRVRKGKA